MTGNYVLFQMWGPFRQSLIDGHIFYVEQARKRLLTQFENIEAEADKASEDWLENNSHRFDPDRDDPGSFYEAAGEAGIEFYRLLSDMRDQTQLSVVAGMFHEWDKQLRDWLVAEVRHWHRGDLTAEKIWKASFSDLADLLEGLGWKIRSTGYFKLLDACRLVVNVYKHGKGTSLDDLKKSFPEYLPDPNAGTRLTRASIDFLDYTYLKVSDVQFQAFSDAIVSFWKDVPENISESDVTSVPAWFEKAILKDRAEKAGAK
ncbi:hypothetical protein [Rhodovulum visakhapatnamense]|uniref:Uncharacterized protein n=1 Tax=Rhodovulum visakhapatnamense TaxID=364297 RepID=A0A4R8F9G9_9RHOB|nr:hypothetical protein [Rhodovulum visakhapatnamense]TDX22186.1 hypothetical protein EV657_13222 [Rhodovulum visakhapatnamense]